MIVDSHSHIMPRIDDGAGHMSETIAMLQEEAAQGVGLVIATPHFYAKDVAMETYLDRRRRRIRAMKDEMGRVPDLPEVRYGAEVYYFPGMGKAESLRELCITNTDCLLVEMPFVQWTSEMVKEIRDLINYQHVTVILAHIERYVEFQRDTRCWEEIMAMPLYTQINAGSFIPQGIFNKKKSKFCLSHVERHDNVILGSDCHNMQNRVPNLNKGREAIERAFGKGRLEQIDALTMKLFLNNKL